MLSKIQKNQFETLGFLSLRQLIPATQMQVFIDAFDPTLVQANGGLVWDQAPKRQQVVPFYKHNPSVYHQLLDHQAVYEVVEDLLGPNFVFSVSEGIQHYGGTGWHHDDIAPPGHTHLKVVFFLDPVRAQTGCLSVLPGSQYPEYRARLENYGEKILAQNEKVPGSYPLEADPGDAVVFNVKLYHAAFGDNSRRGIYLNYMACPQTEDERNYITNLYRRDAAGGWEYYTRELFEDATLKRMTMLQFLKEQCYEAV